MVNTCIVSGLQFHEYDVMFENIPDLSPQNFRGHGTGQDRCIHGKHALSVLI